MSSIKRQSWLERAVRELRPVFTRAGYDVPAEVRVSVGWPRGSHGKGPAIGQCWDKSASTDKHNEIFISPALKHGEQILGVLRHELVHATVGCKEGHKGAFKQCAIAVGLEGKMTATTCGKEAADWGLLFIHRWGKYPGGALNDDKRKKQGTRLLKCECPECGYIARVTNTWIEDVGAPFCGTKSHGRMEAA